MTTRNDLESKDTARHVESEERVYQAASGLLTHSCRLFQ